MIFFLATCLKVVSVFFFYTCFVSQANAWSGDIHGKIMVSAIQHLDTQQVKQLTNLGKALAHSHGRAFKKWRDRYGKQYSEKEAYIGWLGVWPDVIRDKPYRSLVLPSSSASKILHNTKSTSRWHYSNSILDRNFDYIMKCESKNNGQLIGALKELALWLKDKNPEKTHNISREYAVNLSFFVHLFSDLHQPLHNVARAKHKCWHDKGGNGTCLVKRSGSKNCKLNLHQYWDRAGYQKITLDDLSFPSALMTHSASAGGFNVDLTSIDFYEIHKSAIAYKNRLYPRSDNPVAKNKNMDSVFTQGVREISLAEIKNASRRLASILSNL